MPAPPPAPPFTYDDLGFFPFVPALLSKTLLTKIDHTNPYENYYPITLPNEAAALWLWMAKTATLYWDLSGGIGSGSQDFNCAEWLYGHGSANQALFPEGAYIPDQTIQADIYNRMETLFDYPVQQQTTGAKYQGVTTDNPGSTTSDPGAWELVFMRGGVSDYGRFDNSGPDLVYDDTAAGWNPHLYIPSVRAQIWINGGRGYTASQPGFSLAVQGYYANVYGFGTGFDSTEGTSVALTLTDRRSGSPVPCGSSTTLFTGEVLPAWDGTGTAPAAVPITGTLELAITEGYTPSH